MKKFSTLILCFLFIIACTLSGCAGFSVNKIKYYNEVLATVGEEKITRFDLLTAYNSYGQSYYVNQQQMSEQDALKETLNLLIERKSLYLYGKDNANSTNGYAPNEYQVNVIIQNIYDSVDSQMENYVDEAKTILKIESSTEDENNNEEDTIYKINANKYTHRAELDANNNIKYLIEQDPTTCVDANVEPLISNDLLASFDKANNKYSDTIKAIKNNYLTKFKTSLADETRSEELYNKAISFLADDLINYEYYLRDNNNKPYNTITDDLLYRYFERNFNTQIEGQYLTNIRNYYLQDETNLSTNKLITVFDETREYNKRYDYDTDVYKSTMKDIGTDGDKIFYHTNLEDGTKFGYFVHILLRYDNMLDTNGNKYDVKTEIDNKKAIYTGVSKEDILNQEIENILNKVRLNPRNIDVTDEENLGKVDKNTLVSLNDIRTYYKEQILEEKDYQTRLQNFKKLMFAYSGDEGGLANGMPYVVGTNGNTSMVEEFTNEAVALMTGKVDSDVNYTINTTINGGVSAFAGNVSNWDESTKFTDLCVSTYGIHLIMFVDDVSAYDIIDDGVTIEQLNSTIINPMTGETYFDKLFDLTYPSSNDSEYFISENGYTAFEDDLIKTSQQKFKVVKYDTRINSTSTSI